MTNLRYVEEALAGLTVAELHALKVASDESPQVAPELMAWIEGACDGEFNRRRGSVYMLRPPSAAIDPSEGKASIEAAHTMRAFFAGVDQDNGALAFFDALVLDRERALFRFVGHG